MATVSVQKIEVPFSNARLYLWEGLTPGDDGEPVPLPVLSDKTVQVVGDFGTSGQLDVEGSLKGDKAESALVDADFANLTDPQGNAIQATAALIETVQENVYWIRPHVTAGSGSIDLDIYLLVR